MEKIIKYSRGKNPNSRNGFKIGHKIWTGRKHSDKTKQLMAKQRMGRKAWNKGKEYFQIKGDKHPNWQGGLTPLEYKIRNSLRCKEWRLKIFKQDNFICQECEKSIGGDLEAHHKKQLSQIIKDNNIKTLKEAMNCSELWDLNNGVTLCEECHKGIKIIRNTMIRKMENRWNGFRNIERR